MQDAGLLVDLILEVTFRAFSYILLDVIAHTRPFQSIPTYLQLSRKHVFWSIKVTQALSVVNKIT